LLGSQQVPGRGREDPLSAEPSAQARDVDLNRLGGVLRRPGLPQLVDQPIDRERLVRVHEQQREQGTLLAPPDDHRPAVLTHFQQPEDTELHDRPDANSRRKTRQEQPDLPG